MQAAVIGAVQVKRAVIPVSQNHTHVQNRKDVLVTSEIEFFIDTHLYNY